MEGVGVEHVYLRLVSCGRPLISPIRGVKFFFLWISPEGKGQVLVTPARLQPFPARFYSPGTGNYSVTEVMHAGYKSDAFLMKSPCSHVSPFCWKRGLFVPKISKGSVMGALYATNGDPGNVLGL